LTLLFDSDRPNDQGKHDIWMVQRNRVDETWGEPINLGPKINSGSRDYHPSMTADGCTLVFNSDRPGGVGSDGLYMATRPNVNSPWEEATDLGRPINGIGITRASCISPDGLTLVLGADRPGGIGRNDLWITRRNSATEPWGPIENLGAQVNSNLGDKNPSLSSDGLVLVFHSDRVGKLGKFDLYMATRPSLSKPFGMAANLGATMNRAGFDESPSLSPDGKTLWFSADRPGGFGGHDIWYSNRVKRSDR
jgi:Tol biopolymer transport system component